jgi:lactoylglutathione lyase
MSSVLTMYTMAMVSDMNRSVAFYRDLLGLKLRFQSPGWTEFDMGTTTFALHGAMPAAGVRIQSEEPIAGTASIGFGVENVDRSYQELKARGVQFVMPPTDRDAEGIRLAILLDPDGLAISLAETVKK